MLKKFIVPLFAAVALVLGLVAVNSPAQAASYAGTVKTTTSISTASNVKAGGTLTVTVKVKGGTSTPKGNVTVSFAGASTKVALKGGSATAAFKAPKVKSNKNHTVKASYKATSGSVFKDSSASKTVRVVAKALTTKTTIAAPGSVKKGKKFTVTVNVSQKATGKVKISFNGTSKTVTLSGSKASASFTAPKKTGKKTITAKYTPAHGAYKKSESSKKITVKK